MAIDPDFGVVVIPIDDLPEDTRYLIEALSEDLAMLLRSGGERARPLRNQWPEEFAA